MFPSQLTTAGFSTGPAVVVRMKSKSYQYEKKRTTQSPVPQDNHCGDPCYTGIGTERGRIKRAIQLKIFKMKTPESTG